MTLLRLGYQILNLDNYVMKLCTQTGLRQLYAPYSYLAPPICVPLYMIQQEYVHGI